FDDVRDARGDRTSRLSSAVTQFGGGRAEQISFAILAAGLLFRNDSVRDVGRDAVEAQILASHIITPLLKRTAGRSRPRLDEGAGSFQPSSGGGGHDSFPSGHTTTAFALASVLAGHSHGRMVPVLVYGVAAAVGYSRVNDGAHWPSDVLAGAVVGTTVGREIVIRHTDPARSTTVQIIPLSDGRGASGIGMRIVY
ncbi:MAG: phosphatase PAP2 family protein, partial [Thermoanaerobaculia bacterium]